MITAELLRTIVDGYPLDPGGVHGLAHWARVLENGRRLAAATGADVRVVELFAVFHDALRENDGIDPGHGRRGAGLACRLRGRLFDLDDAAFDLLIHACETHTDGGRRGDATVCTCWDADRLDLGRCGIEVDPQRLATDAAREPGLLRWAIDRATTGTPPPLLTDVWRPLLDGNPGGHRERP